MSILNNENEMLALGIKPENYATASLTQGQSARIASMTAESIPGIETKKTIINETNTALYTSLGDTYEILKKIYKNFDKTYLRAPTSNSERKKKYDRLQTLQKEFNDEYERINSILPYTGNDKTIRTRIAEIRRYYEMKRNDIAEKIKIIKVNVEPLPSNNAIKAKTQEFKEKAEKYRKLLERMKMNTNARNNSRLAHLPVTPSASATTPAPVPVLAPPPPPPRAPPRQWPPPGPIRLPGRNTRKNAPLPKPQPIVVPPLSAPPLSSNLQNNTNLENARTRAQNLIDKSLLGKQPTISKMYTNTRKKSNKNALKNRSLASLYPNMNSFEEQPAPINAPQPQSQTNPNAPAVNIDLLGTLEEKYNIVAKPNSSTRERIRALNSTMKEQHAKYIQTMPDKIVYKIVDIDTSNDTAKVAPLDRVTKIWGPVEQLTKEQINSSRIVDCNLQAGGKRTTRRRIVKHHRHRTARRKSGK